MGRDLAKAYSPKDVEDKWARTWVDQETFRAQPDPGREAFSVVIPPPNITGQLHLGHALNNTLQDVLVRFHKMDGHDVLWVPGTDHASIATQNVVERQLQAQGTDRHEVGREAFLEKTFAWKAEVGGYILSQLQRLGAGCDWTRERFTMDEGLSEAVREVFVRLYDEGLIYRGRRLINWCCRCGTALSDIEVEHQDTKGHLWHLRYPLADGSGSVTVATTRPETMLGDTAVAVHPQDERYAALVGKTVRLPVVDREIPIIADDVVDREFGSGAVKITPAHDFNDFETGQRNDLPMVSVIDETGVMTDEAGPYAGLDRAECRKKIVADFEESGTLVETEDHAMAVGTCYRCQQVVEPLLSTQWFVEAKPLADPAIEAVRDGRTRFHPEHWSKTYYAWLTNIRDWCISRQLWWGHRIPAWYCDACTETAPDGTTRPRVFVAREAPAACECGGPLRQDEDVLDTWFSSGLWPFSTMGWPEKTAELERYYPTSVLVTGFDILFFWVARMMMFGLRFTGEVPFRDVYVHGLVRDEYGAKMSKSKGNVQDPLELLGTYGTDALRFTLVAQSAMGRDIRLSVDRIDGNRNFANKIWNAARFTLMNLEDYTPGQGEVVLDAPARWIRTRLAGVTEDLRAALAAYRFNDLAEGLYHFFWHEFCDWYVELAKLGLSSGDEARRRGTQQTLLDVFDAALRLLHPLMPFVTDELWHALPHEGEVPESLVDSTFPTSDGMPTDSDAETQIELLIQVVRSIRSLRAEMSVAPSRAIDVQLAPASDAQKVTLQGLQQELVTLARIENLTYLAPTDRPKGVAVAMADGVEIFVPLAGLVDVGAERARLTKEIEKVRKDLKKVQGKLSNEKFMSRAPEDVVAKERGKQQEFESTLALLEKGLDRLEEVDA